MPAPYSEELRQKVMAAVDRCERKTDVSRIFNPHSALQFSRQTLRFICYSFENQIRRQKTNLVEVENYV